MSPEISFILATKNRPSQATNFYKNLKQLKRPGDEVIIVDGSDGLSYAEDVFGSVADKILVKQDRNIPHALNLGIVESTKPYIKLLMDDDYFVPEATWQAFDIMERHGIDAMQTGGKRFFSGFTKEELRKSSDPSGSYDCLQDPNNPAGVYCDFGSDPAHASTYGATGVGHFYSRNLFPIAGLLHTRFLIWDIEFMARAMHCQANVKYCRLYAYEHPITRESTLGNPKKFGKKMAIEKNFLRRFYGVNADEVGKRVFRHKDKAEANYDGGFS